LTSLVSAHLEKVAVAVSEVEIVLVVMAVVMADMAVDTAADVVNPPNI
jgi:hypothetical protein